MSKYTSQVHKAIVDELKAGLFLRHAAARAGVTSATISEWMRLGRAGVEPYTQLALDVDAAETRDIARLHKVVADAAKGDWRAAAWLLERKAPTTYRRQPVGAKPSPADTSSPSDRVFSPWIQQPRQRQLDA